MNKEEYLISFSSYYKAIYALEKLRENGISSSLKKTPANLLKSCGYSLYLRTANIYYAADVLRDYNIENRGIFYIERVNGTINYKLI